MKKILKIVGYSIAFILPLVPIAVVAKIIIYNNSTKTKKIDLNTIAINNQDNVEVSQESSGKYQITEGDKSIIKDHGEGALYGFSSPDNAIEFVVSSRVAITASANSQGYKIRKLSNIDPLWDPGSCAQKPSMEFDNRYIMISELDSYNFYDTVTKKYKNFGLGDSMKSIYVTSGEKNTMIMYMYTPQKNSTNTNSTLNSNNNFIIRRTVNISDFSYIDHKITITNLEANKNFVPKIYYDGSRILTLVLHESDTSGTVDYYTTKRYWANLNDLSVINMIAGDINSREYNDKFTIKPGIYNVDKENVVNGKVYNVTDFTVPAENIFILGALNI